ncbi:MAG: hypothetical protein QXP88_00295, partial [Thermoproteota archaeon]
MPITHLTQLEITNSSNEDDTLLDSSTNVSADSLEKDLNYIRSVLKNIIGNGNWHDFSNTKKLTDISSFINSVSTGTNYINANKIDFSTSVVVNPDSYPAVLRGSSDWIKVSNFIPGITNANKLLWAYISYTTTDIDTAIQNTPTILNLQASIGSNNTSLQNQINSLNTTVTNHENRITSLENDVTSTANSSSIINRVSTAESNITTLFNNLATTNGNVTTLQGQVSTISTNVSNLSAQIGTFTQTQYNAAITSLNSSVSGLNPLVSSLQSSVNTLEPEINIILIPNRDKTLGRNSFILDFKNYNYFDTSLLQNNNFNTILLNFISLLTTTYLVDIIYFQFPLDKLTTTEINNLNQALTQLKTAIYQNLNKKIKIGIYIDLYKAVSDTTYNAFSTASNNFTQKISSIFTNTNFVYIDALLLGPLDAIEYYTFNTNTSTYTFTQITDTLSFVDIIFSNSINFLENKNVPVILAFKNPDFLLSNFTRITSISSSMKYLIPSTYIYTLNNVDYPYNLESLGAEIYYLDALVDPSECGTTYTTPYDYSYICAYTDPARYTALNSATPPLIDGSFTSNIPTDQFLYAENVAKLKNRNLFSTVGITNPAVTNSAVFNKSAAIVLNYDTTNSSSPTYSLNPNTYKKYQLNTIQRNYISLIQKQEFVESSGAPSLFNPHIEIAASQDILKPFISYDYSNTTDGLEILIGIDFTNKFSISLLNDGLFNKESTYTNVFTATLSSGTLTITSGANTAAISSISAGLHLLKAKFTST